MTATATQIQRLTTSKLVVLEAPEADEVKVILRQMLDDLSDQEASMAQAEAKTAQEVADAQGEVTKYETSLVTLSNEADKASQAATAADLQREVSKVMVRRFSEPQGSACHGQGPCHGKFIMF